jgi:hypothetical protein
VVWELLSLSQVWPTRCSKVAESHVNGRQRTTHFCAQEELIALNGVHFQRQRIIRHQLPHGFSGEWMSVLEHQRLGAFPNVICSFHLITLILLSAPMNQERIATSHSMQAIRQQLSHSVHPHNYISLYSHSCVLGVCVIAAPINLSFVIALFWWIVVQ